jgi:hypothetical protein
MLSHRLCVGRLQRLLADTLYVSTLMKPAFAIFNTFTANDSVMFKAMLLLLCSALVCTIGLPRAVKIRAIFVHYTRWMMASIVFENISPHPPPRARRVLSHPRAWLMPENPAGNVLKPASGTRPSLQSLSNVSARMD